jgi:hypothetical protein
MTTPLLAKAITFAQEKHEGQRRKATGLPYITHLAGVALLVKLFKRSKNLEALVCAAYLHDTRNVKRACKILCRDGLVLIDGSGATWVILKPNSLTSTESK